jgi:hypothetical protein
VNHPRRFEQEYARRCLDLLAGGGSPVTQVPFRVQTLWLDEQTAIVGLNCEPLHAVGAAIEQMFAPRHAIILGYTGGCICYAPDTAELLRGGYEAESYLFETWAGPWATGFENTFRSAVVAKPAQH